MAELGRFALMLGLFLAGYAVAADLLGGRRKEPALVKSGRNATAACWLCVTVAAAALLVLLLRRDFAIAYVAAHTSSKLPLAYTVSAFWAGAAGSLLLWLWLQVGFVVLAFCRTSPDSRTFASSARAAANLVAVFFLLVLILDKNPFARSGVVPADGQGLNPLLQHPAMALHPPTLFVGYAALCIPFAWALAGLKDRGETTGAEVFRRARTWMLWGWLFLTVGIALGAWWAYEELGWGGYWGWDPVENSSLLPWLIATAMLHCARFYSTRSSIELWVKLLAIVTFSLCIFGTFLTRYGLVSSVHAFPEPGLGILFLVLLAVIWVAAAYRLWCRGRPQPVVPTQTTAPSGPQPVIWNTWLVILLTFVIFIGTLFPLFSGLVFGRKITLSSSYFTKITALPGLALLLFLAVCPYTLRGGIARNRRVIAGLICAVAAVGGWLVADNVAVACFVICGLAGVNLAIDLVTASRATTGFKSLRWYGARIAHVGVVLVFLGIAGSGGYGLEAQAALSPGQSTNIAGFTVKYDGLSADHRRNFTAVTAEVTVSRDDEVIARLKPARAYYRGDRQTSEVDIRRTLAGDFYVAVTGVDTTTGLINLMVLIKPLVNWIWIGSATAVFGAALVLFSIRRRPRVQE